MELLVPAVRQEAPGEQVVGRPVRCLTYSCRIATTSSTTDDGAVGLPCHQTTHRPVPPLVPMVLEKTPTSWCTRIKELLVQLKSFTHSSDSNEIN